MSFHPVKARRIFEAVADQIRAHLAAGDLRPGDRLPPEREMAQQLGVSRNGLREALRALEIAGVIRLRSGAKGGAYVSHGDPSHVSQLLQDQFNLGALTLDNLTEARLWICPMVVRAACQRATDEDLSALTANVDEAERLYDAAAWDRKIEVQVAFHNVLAASTRNPVIVILMESLSGMTLEMARRIGPEKSRDTIDSRRRLLRHLRARDEDAAAREIEDHLLALQQRYLAALGHGGGRATARSVARPSRAAKTGGERRTGTDGR